MLSYILLEQIKKKTYKEKEKAKRGNKEEVKRNLSHRWE